MTDIIVGMTAQVARPDGTTLAHELDRLERLGVDLVEIPLLSLDVMARARILPGPLGRLVEACAGRAPDFSVHAAIGLNFFGAPEHLPLHFDVLRASLDVAARLRARHVVMHSGFCAGDAPDLEDRYARQRAWLARAGVEAAARDLVICVENIFPFGPGVHTASPARLAREIAALGDAHVRATLDVGHGFLHAGARGGDAFAEAVTLSEVAAHVHLHDSFGVPEDTFWAYTEAEKMHFGLGDLHLPLGWGGLPLERLMREARFPESCSFVVELPERFVCEAAETLAEARRLAKLAREAARAA
ncbi:sugar phosphate isomerase/epimerase family protein [Salinarimonas rosea]|uniref:sugar phosphate isomerase/epimerase family protein n=1 Tax=Salinarimonas rosea TaxID=552063 RepID=UPI000407CEE3|nr:sugar phosphate isomerase/epimerase [Salinarimonas rosea]